MENKKEGALPEFHMVAHDRLIWVWKGRVGSSFEAENPSKNTDYLAQRFPFPQSLHEVFTFARTHRAKGNLKYQERPLHCFEQQDLNPGGSYESSRYVGKDYYLWFLHPALVDVASLFQAFQAELMDCLGDMGGLLLSWISRKTG